MKARFRSYGFLSEVLISILIFSLACSALVGVFVRASSITETTNTKSIAATENYTIYQNLRANGIEKTGMIRANAAGELYVTYDEKWRQTDKEEDAAYIIKIYYTDEQKTAAGTLYHVEFVASRYNNAAQEPLHVLQASYYVPKEGGDDA